MRHYVLATVYDKRGNVLSRAENSYTKTHPYQAMMARRSGIPEKIFLHAEIAALIRCRTGQPYRIKIERYNKSNEPMLAKPCPICEAAIKEAGIRLVEYTIG